MPLLTAYALAVSTPSARDLVERAMVAMGGRERLASIRQVKVQYSAHDTMPEQSERPTGPFLIAYNRGERTYDFDALTESGSETLSGIVFGPREMSRKIPAAPKPSYATMRRLALGPERVLLVAAAARDLGLGKDLVYQGAPHATLTFRWGDVPTELLVNRRTGMPTAVVTTRTLDGFWGIWGDVRQRTAWGAWQLAKGGFMEPSQFTTDVNDIPTSDLTVLNVEVASGPGRPTLPLPPPVAALPSAQWIGRYTPAEVVPGVVQYRGPYNTTVVDQGDGLVVIEPVVDSAFAGAFLDGLAKTYPGKRVKAVIATDDAWPHFGGIRTFAARGATLVGLDLNRPLVERLLAASHLTRPDEYARGKVRPKTQWVKEPITLGKGANRLVLYPIAGEGSERMLMACFPEHRLLYGSDLLQKVPTGFFFPAYPKELRDAVVRERLDVDKVFGEHLNPTPWTEITTFVEGQTSGKS
ncbi:MAG: hypothetical protein ACO1SV_02295 [Fimbriimonas sp.]